MSASEASGGKLFRSRGSRAQQPRAPTPRGLPTSRCRPPRNAKRTAASTDLPAYGAPPTVIQRHIENRFNAVGFGIYLGGPCHSRWAALNPRTNLYGSTSPRRTNTGRPRDLPGRAECLRRCRSGRPFWARGMPHLLPGVILLRSRFSPRPPCARIIAGPDARVPAGGSRTTRSGSSPRFPWWGHVLALPPAGRYASARTFVRCPPSGAALGRAMAQEMRAADFGGNPFREFARRSTCAPNARFPARDRGGNPVATAEFNPTMGTMPPQGGIRRPVPRANPTPRDGDTAGWYGDDGESTEGSTIVRELLACSVPSAGAFEEAITGSSRWRPNPGSPPPVHEHLQRLPSFGSGRKHPDCYSSPSLL